VNAVGGDQHVGTDGFITERKCDAVAVLPDTRDFGAEVEPDLRFGICRLAQYALQVGPVNDAIRGAIASARRAEQRDRRQRPPARSVTDDQGARFDRIGGKGIGQAEALQYRHGVGRKLDAGADIGERVGAFMDGGGKTAPGQRDRGGQAGNAGAGDRYLPDVAAVVPVRRSSGKQAIARLALTGAEIGFVAVVRRTIGADDLALLTHIKKDMGMIMRRQGADAHEFLAADGDLFDTVGIVKMRDDVVGHKIPVCCWTDETGRTLTPARQDE
jgi:hypothetical protein